MKHLCILILFAHVGSVGFAQDRILISPFGDAIPVEKGKSARQAVEKNAETHVGTNTIISNCDTGTVLFGNIDWLVPPYSGFAYGAGDVSAMIYVVPFSGNITSVHWKPNANTFTNLDATLRISKSRILNTGNTTATYWGYFPDSNDADIEQAGHTKNTPWPDDATGAYVPGAEGTINPIGDNLWGGEIGGFQITWPNGPTTQDVNMSGLGYEPAVNAGDTIVITIQKSAFVGSGTASNATFRASSPAMPFRFMKYYYFGRTDAAAPGWWAREFDMLIWATMRVPNPPPVITFVTPLPHTLDTGPRDICLYAHGCGVDSSIAGAIFVYRVNGGAWDTLSFVHTDSGWCVTIPGQPAGSTVTYYMTVTDIHGYTTTTSAKTYRAVDLNRANYVYSTPPFSFIDIAGDPGATELPGSAFQGTGANDDGTAGPIPIGGNFNFFGRDTMRYAWVSANGGIGLTGTSTDTVWVNSNGTRTGSYANFNIPGTAPRNFIAGFWSDLYLAPSGHGSVWYKQVEMQLIVQWNKAGNFNSSTDTNTTFQIILDRNDSSVTFKYFDVGNTSLNLEELVGMQANSSNLWTFINQFGYPIESRPANNTSIKLKERILTGVEDRGGELPTKFALYPNYPNPFNPTTTIRYELPKQVVVSLKVYNLLGQEVASLVSEVQSTGKHQAEFRAENLSSGVYFYRLQAAEFVETKKLLLLK